MNRKNTFILLFLTFWLLVVIGAVLFMLSFNGFKTEKETKGFVPVKIISNTPSLKRPVLFLDSDDLEKEISSESVNELQLERPVQLSDSVDNGNVSVFDSQNELKCKRKVIYDIGDVDSRFGLSKEEFRKIVLSSESIWENSIGDDNVFTFKEGSDFKINLVYDYRQELALANRKLSNSEEEYENDIDELESKYADLIDDYEDKKDEHEDFLNSYNEKVEAYNEKISELEGAKRVSADDYKKLEEDFEEIQDWRSSLEDLAEEIDDLIDDINEVVKKENKLSEEYSDEYNSYHEKYGFEGTFDKGFCTNEKINIFQFYGEDDLTLVLAHEMGHAIGIGHNNNEYSVMFSVIDKQKLNPISLSEEDLSDLKNVCGIKN